MATFEPELVRCVDCGREYLPAPDAEVACPDCGTATWVAAHIPLGADERPHDDPRLNA
jgi:hypothetical protein